MSLTTTRPLGPSSANGRRKDTLITGMYASGYDLRTRADGSTHRPVLGAVARLGAFTASQTVRTPFTYCCGPETKCLLVYKHTRKVDYLQTARKMAKYWITNTPSDGIIPW